MKECKRLFGLFTTLLVLLFLGSCGKASPVMPLPLTVFPSHTPTAVPSITPFSSTTPSPVPAVPSTPDFCSSALWQDKIQILSSDLLTSLEPGGPIQYDQILAEHDPAWADFRQSMYGEIRSAGVVFHETAFGPELGEGISPAVLLVTYGVDHNWELPANGDLFSEVDRIRAVLRRHESDWIRGTVGPDQYPMVANGATYVLYRYFDGDVSRLEKWCYSWVEAFGESPIK